MSHLGIYQFSTPDLGLLTLHKAPRLSLTHTVDPGFLGYITSMYFSLPTILIDLVDTTQVNQIKLFTTGT